MEITSDWAKALLLKFIASHESFYCEACDDFKRAWEVKLFILLLQKYAVKFLVETKNKEFKVRHFELFSIPNAILCQRRQDIENVLEKYRRIRIEFLQWLIPVLEAEEAEVVKNGTPTTVD